MPQQLSTNTFTSSTWIVNSDATKGTHTTLGAALTTSVSGDTILLQTSVTENVTGKAGVNIVGYSGAESTPNVSITGTISFASAGTLTIKNIRLTTNSTNILAVTGSAASIVNLNNCYLNCTNNTGISFTTSNAAAQVNLNNCTGDLGTTGISFGVSSSTGQFNFYGCHLTNTGTSLTATACSAGQLNVNWTEMFSPVSATGSGALGSSWSRFQAQGNTAAAVINSSTQCNATFCIFSGGSASAITIAVGSTYLVDTCLIFSTNTNAITGAGTLSAQFLSFTGTSAINVTTQNGGIAIGSTVQAPAAGYIGEQIRSYASGVGLSNNNPANITSISLTAGVWDISAATDVVFGTSAGAYLISAISTTSGSVTTGSVQGDSRVTITPAAATFAELWGAIPSYRVVLTATTTYYLTTQAGFAAGVTTATGRISATRVA